MSIKLPTLSALWRGAVSTFLRFPFTLLASMIMSGIMMYMVSLKHDQEKELEYLFQVVMAASLGLSLTFALALFSERSRHSLLLRLSIQTGAALAAAGYFFSLPEFKDMNYSEGAQFALFNLGLHLLVAFAPFIGRDETNGFWQFNKSLFLRFLLSALYSAVLFIGLALALLAVDQLFGVNIKDYRYGQLWFFLAGIFNTWFFLAGVPEKLDELESATDYPKGLKIFTQFVLLPLVTVYLVILYAYGFKILFEWSLPKGWVSWLVNAFSVFGILSLLLIWPIRNDEGNKWISTFSKWFYTAVFPLIVLLGVAIGKRVGQYGITENRYFVMVVALWLLGIALYFLLSRKKNIKLIPVSLCLVAFLSSFGPWGAFRVSERSQVNRLEGLLIREEILVNGKIVKATDTIDAKNGEQIASIVRYLDQHHGFDAVQPWFAADFDTLFATDSLNEYVYEGGKILELMGVEDYYGRLDYNFDEGDSLDDRTRNFYYYAENVDNHPKSISGYDYLIEVNRYFGDDTLYNAVSINPMIIGQDTCQLRWSPSRKQVLFFQGNRERAVLHTGDFVKKIRDYNRTHKKHQHDNYVPDELMELEAQGDSLRLKLIVTNISGQISSEGVKISNINGALLIGK